MSASDRKRREQDQGRGQEPRHDRPETDQEEDLDEALEESFPASDPPSPTRPQEHPGRTPKKR